MNKPIPYTKPSITQLEIDFAADATTNGWGTRCYEYIERFEREFCNFLGTKYAVATSSCTGALTLGLAALGIDNDDEVIIADTNWIASVAPVAHLGAKPIFVDVLPDTWCLDPTLVEKAITPRTKAIIAVHLYGNCCAMQSLLEIGAKYKIPIIEDAAEAIGTKYEGKRAGSMGLFGVFSFHGTKTMTTGEGGIFVTNDQNLYETVLTLSNHGREKNQTKQFWPDRIGYKFKMSNVQAAIGCAQLHRIEELVTRKRDILAKYRDAFADISTITMNPEPPGVVNGAWMPTIVLKKNTGISSEKLLEAFRREKIDARVFFHPLSSLDFFDECPENTNSYALPAQSLNLPSFHEMTAEEQTQVCQVVRRCIVE